MNGWLQVIHVLCKNCLLYKCATICPTYAGGHLGCFQLLAIGGKKCCDMSPDTQSTCFCMVLPIGYAYQQESIHT